METGPLLIVFFAIGFGCFFWTNNIINAFIALFCTLIVLAVILAVVTQGWGIVVLLFYPHIWIPAFIFGAVIGWIFRWISEPQVKEKSE
jgi:hypothetical protein